MEQKKQKTDKRRTKTHNAMMSAGTRLFADNVPEGVTIDQIVLEADIAKGSFYNHFDDKDGYAQAVFDFIQEQMEVHIAEVNKDVENPAHRLLRALNEAVDYNQKYPKKVKAINNLSRRHTEAGVGYNLGITKDIEAGISEDIFHGISVEEGVVIGLGIISFTLLHTAIEHQNELQALKKSMGAALLRGLGVAGEKARTMSEDVIDGMTI